MAKRKSKGGDEGAKAKATKKSVTEPEEASLKEVRELPHVKKFEDWL